MMLGASKQRVRCPPPAFSSNPLPTPSFCHQTTPQQHIILYRSQDMDFLGNTSLQFCDTRVIMHIKRFVSECSARRSQGSP